MEEKLAVLEKMLEKYGVPRAFWPKIIESEKFRMMRIQRSDKLWLQRLEELKKRDAEEQKRHAQFLRLLIFLLFLMELESWNAESFFHQSWSIWADQKHPGLHEGQGIEEVEMGIAGVALCKFSQAQVEDALHTGRPIFERQDRPGNRGRVGAVFPMRIALRAVTEHRVEEEANAWRPAPVFNSKPFKPGKSKRKLASPKA